MAGYGYAYSPSILRAKKAVAAPPAFSPSDLAGLKLWLKSDAGITLNGNNVSQWDDQSGNGNHAVQATASEQPEWIDDILNGKPILEFDGGNDVLHFIAITNIRTAFWVIKEDPAATANYRPILGHSSLYNFHRGDDGKKMWGGDTHINIRNGVTRINGQIVNGENTDVPIVHSIISLVTIGNVSADNFSIDRGMGGRVWDGSVAEIIIYDNTLSDTDREKVELYLQTKYFP